MNVNASVLSLTVITRLQTFMENLYAELIAKLRETINFNGLEIVR